MNGITTITVLGTNKVIEKRTCNYNDRFEEINRIMELYKDAKDFVGIHTTTTLRQKGEKAMRTNYNFRELHEKLAREGRRKQLEQVQKNMAKGLAERKEMLEAFLKVYDKDSTESYQRQWMRFQANY